MEQEAQLTHGRATLSVVETIKCSLRIIERHWKWHHSTTYYWSAIVNIALSCTSVELFDIENIVTVKSGLEVTQGH